VLAVVVECCAPNRRLSKRSRPHGAEVTTPERYNEGADRAVLLLQRTRDLLLECRVVAQQLEALPAEPEPPAERAERVAYGVLVAALENGLVKTLQAQRVCWESNG